MTHLESHIQDESCGFLRRTSSAHPPWSPLSGKQILFRLVDVPERGEEPEKKAEAGQRAGLLLPFIRGFTPLPATETRREWCLASWEGMGVGGSRLHAVKNITPPGKIKSGRCYVSDDI